MNKYKKLYEKREQNIAQMELLTTTAENEQRAMTEEEQAQFNALEAEVRAIDATIEAGERTRQLDHVDNPDEERAEEEQEERAEDIEERAFANFIRGVVEERADYNLNASGNAASGTNSAVIPTTIANKIIAKVVEISPIYQMADKYPVGGTLTIPYYDEATHKITVGYATEFTDLESTSGDFASITLQSFLVGALTKISRSLINNSQFDIVGYVVDRMAESIAAFLDKELIQGTASKVEGLSGATQIKTAAAATAITSDELIDVQAQVPDRYQNECIWVMNKATRTAISKLKDGQNNYLLIKDANARWGHTLLGADVYVSDGAPTMAAGNAAVIYGDMSGLAVKLSEELSIEVLRERYAPQHAVGVVAWMELDSKIEDQQKISVLKMHAS